MNSSEEKWYFERSKEFQQISAEWKFCFWTELNWRSSSVQSWKTRFRNITGWKGRDNGKKWAIKRRESMIICIVYSPYFCLLNKLTSEHRQAFISTPYICNYGEKLGKIWYAKTDKTTQIIMWQYCLVFCTFFFSFFPLADNLIRCCSRNAMMMSKYMHIYSILHNKKTTTTAEIIFSLANRLFVFWHNFLSYWNINQIAAKSSKNVCDRRPISTNPSNSPFYKISNPDGIEGR